MRLIDIEPVLKAAELVGKELVSIDLLKDFEQVDAVPVVRGEWIKVDQVYVKCSHCDKHYYNLTREYGYCPNCGADMRGSEVKE